MTVEGDVRTDDGRTVRFYDTGSATDAFADGDPHGEAEAPSTIFWHHGTPQTGRLLAPVVAAARARGIRVVSCARAGYEGTSPIAARTVLGAATDVIRVADELGIETFGVVGASGGAPHALACAVLAPRRVQAVVSIAGLAPFDGTDEWFEGMAAPGALRSALHGRAERARFAETAEFDETSFTERDWAALAGDWGSLGEDAQRASGLGSDGEVDDDVAYTTPWGFDLEEIATPVLLVQGGQDRVVPASHAHRMLDKLGRAELWLRPRDGHVSVLGSLPVALDWFRDAVRAG